MDSKAHTMLGFKWVKKEDLQSTTKINAQDDCPQKAKSPSSGAFSHQVRYYRPHHQWIPKGSFYPEVNGWAWIQEDLLQPKSAKSSSKKKTK